MDFSNQYDEINNSVVKILSSFKNDFYQQIIVESGSGVLFGDGSMALTCSHCIRPNTFTTCITEKNKTSYGKIIYNNPIIDIAIIQFNQSLGKGVKLGNSDDIKIGQETFVVGFPSHTKSISALGANISGIESNKIIIDASVNHGNSGGPLFNIKAELIGIVNAKLGNVSKALNQIEDLKYPPMLQIGGIDAFQVIQQLITDIKKNLNLGMGIAIPLKTISLLPDLPDLVKNLLEDN